MLADLEQDEKYAYYAVWYRAAEDADLSVEEIASLYGESLATVNEGLNAARDDLRFELDKDSAR